MANEKEKRKQDPEQARRKKEEQARRSRRRNRQLLGFVLSILIIWGAVSIVISGIDLVQNILDNTEEKLEFQDRIEMLVLFDVLPFEDVYQLDDEVLKQVGIWAVFNQMGEELESNEFDEKLVPSVDVDRWAQSLFGASFQFADPHGTFYEQGLDIEYIYEEETGSYVLPATSIQSEYLPTVVDIERMSGGYRRVVVGYAATSDGSGGLYSTIDYEHPVRYMDFIFRRDGNEYYLERLERNTTYEVTVPEGSESAVEDTGTPAVVPGEEGDATVSTPAEDDVILDDGADESAGTDEADGPENEEETEEGEAA